MSLLFALTLFLAAALSFVVQPLIARQLLPLAGGAPAVWTTCLVFFQLMLLAGYAWAHFISRKRREVQIFHFACAAAILLSQSSDIRLKPDGLLAGDFESSPVLFLGMALALSVGLVYFALATTAPLLQVWFTSRMVSEPVNPYPLYAASNAGSLIGLLSYPFLIEPYFPIESQRYWWRILFFIAIGLIVACAAATAPRQRATPPPAPREAISSGLRLKWIGLSALTASLLASVTAHLSTDIAPMPLLWVVPLALYLLTYIITFARWSERSRRLVGRLAPMAICFSVVALLTQATEPMALIVAVHLIGLTLVCFLCHGELASSKPAPGRLTDFYLCLALGGVLGGSVNAILAPFIFTHLGPIEYPIALVLAALVQPHKHLRPVRGFDLFAPVCMLIVTIALDRLVSLVLEAPATDDEAGLMLDRVIRGGLLFGIPVAISFALVWRPLRFALCLAAVLVVGLLLRSQTNHTLAVERNFFGTLTVTRTDEFTVLTHGTTRHGMQKLGEPVPNPMMYYHRRGPLGRVFRKPAQTVGVVGLGCGAMAAYAEPGQHWTFFEIDPAVVRIANDERYFTFLKTCKITPKIVIGDARRKLADVPDGTFDLLAIDAFSSDAVPVHLLTKEAFELYLRKLAPHGRLLLHLSNRYLDLPSLTGRVVRSIDPSLTILEENDSAADHSSGKWASHWVAISRNPVNLMTASTHPNVVARLEPMPFFVPLKPHPGPVWTDDYAPLRGVWKRAEE